MLSPAPATLQHGRDTDRADTEVSSLPGAGPKPGLPAASLAHLLGIMVQNSARVILLLVQFSAITLQEQDWGPRTDMSAASSRDIDV